MSEDQPVNDRAAKDAAIRRLRTPPPPFRVVTVTAVDDLTPHMRLVTFGGEALQGLEVDELAASIRLLIPKAPGADLVLPEWTGNEWELPGGERPRIRTFTPPVHAAAETEITLQIVRHDGGGIAGWAADATPGDPAALAGPGRGYAIDGEAPAHLLIGDESALPALGQLVSALAEATPAGHPTWVHVETRATDAHESTAVRYPFPAGIDVQWHPIPEGGAPGDALVPAIEDQEIPAETRVWAAGEAAAVHRLRRHLFDERGLRRSQATVRGYWKHGRAGA